MYLNVMEVLLIAFDSNFVESNEFSNCDMNDLCVYVIFLSECSEGAVNAYRNWMSISMHYTT